MPVVLPLQIRKAPIVYQYGTISGKKSTGNGIQKVGGRAGTFYDPNPGQARVLNCGATGFEFAKSNTGIPVYRYFPSLSKANWSNVFIYGQPEYADSSHPRYTFWQFVAPDLYTHLNSYHPGGLPKGALVKAWVSWDKLGVSAPRGFFYDENSDQWHYENKRSFAYSNACAGVCGKYAIFS